MSERPILFSGEMVRAILDGRKSQTRRVVSDGNYRGNVKPSRCDLSKAWVDDGPSPAGNPGQYLKAPVVLPEDVGIVERVYPPYFAGDRLWVRETWAAWATSGAGTTLRVRYAADDVERDIYIPDTQWRLPQSVVAGGNAPSIFMPRWASRITLEITNVRAERIRDISAEDCRAEGVDGGDSTNELGWRYSFGSLWNSINEKRGYGWDANPWAWCISFRVVLTASLATERESAPNETRA